MDKLKPCEICKTKEYEEIHHKDLNHANNEKGNLQHLCKSCHYKQHGKTQRIDRKKRIEEVNKLVNLLKFDKQGKYLGRA